MKNLTWQNPEQLFVAQELINKVKSKCCGIKDNQFYDTNVFVYFRKRLIGLYKPFVIYGFAFLLLHNLFVYIGFYREDDIYTFIDFVTKLPKLLLFSYYEPIVGVFWFLKSLFVVTCSFCMIRYIANYITPPLFAYMQNINKS